MIQMPRGKKISKQRIPPVAPGVFTWQMLWADSLEIDRDYSFRFTGPEPRTRGLFRRYTPDAPVVSGEVYYEDYVLDEVTYTFSQDKESYTLQDSIVFHLGARDANGQSIPDGRYTLVVRTEAAHSFYAQEVLLPDTIWRTEGALAASGDLDIRLPEHLLPEGSYQLLATFYGINSAGELQKKELRLFVDRRIAKLEASIQKGWLLVDWKDKATIPSWLTLREEYPNMAAKVMSIPAPYRVRVKPEVQAYTISSGKESLYLGLNDKKRAGHQVSNNAFRVRDTVVCMLQNPHRIPVQYRVMRGKKEWDAGVTSDSLWVWQQIDTEGNDFHFYYTFVWAAQEEQGFASVLIYKNMLEVSVAQPEEVLPGEQVQVKVRVKDQANQPAAGVNLTAGAYNSLFGDQKPYYNPEIKYRKNRSAAVYTLQNQGVGWRRILPAAVGKMVRTPVSGYDPFLSLTTLTSAFYEWRFFQIRHDSRHLPKCISAYETDTG